MLVPVEDKTTCGCQCPPFRPGTALFEPSLGAFLPRKTWLSLLDPPSCSDGSTGHEEPEPQIQQGTRWTNPGTPPVPGTAPPRQPRTPGKLLGMFFYWNTEAPSHPPLAGSLQLCFARGKQSQFGPFSLCWSLNLPMLQPWLSVTPYCQRASGEPLAPSRDPLPCPGPWQRGQRGQTRSHGWAGVSRCCLPPLLPFFAPSI